MQELQLTNQMEIIGGGVGTWIVCVVVGAAVYKMLYSSSGRISIPRLISIEGTLVPSYSLLIFID